MKKIQIKGTIVDDDTAIFYDYFGMTYTSPKKVADILNDDKIGDKDNTIVVDIASNGGDVFAASEIYSALKESKADIKVNIVGLAASAASVIAMAGNTVSIAPTAQIMIHKAWTKTNGNTDDLKHEASVLNNIDKSIATAYELKTGLKQSDILQMMSNETWLTAQDAVDKGFADEIMFVSEDNKAVMNSVNSIPNKAAINKLMNLILKTKKQNNKMSQLSIPSLKDKKLAILYGKEE